jgi:hypothetical protein
MSAFRNIAAASALVAMAASLPAQAQVDVIQSASPALARGSTFAWASVPARGYGVMNPLIANEVTADRLRAVTEFTLRNKGYRQVDNPQQADLLVTYTIVMLPETDAGSAGERAGCAAPICDGPIDYSFDARPYTHGTLVLDLIERRSGRHVWRATSEKRVGGRDVSQQKLSALLRKMTRSLPPK